MSNIIERRGNRGLDEGCSIAFTHPRHTVCAMGVPERLERVIDNLLDNAASFSAEGSTIDVVIEHEGDVLLLMVMDEGPGIAPEARSKVFERFHSDRPESESFGNHSGLGLAIARTIAEAHGGTLSAQDRPDGKDGACLVLALPALPDEDTYGG